MRTKEKILLSVLAMGSERGLSNVSLSQIADDVGIKKATIYSHFSSKEELIEELYHYLREQAKEKVVTEPIDYTKYMIGMTAEQVLNSVVQNYIKMNSQPNMMQFYRIITTEKLYSKDAAMILLEETKKMHNATKQLLTAMCDVGLFVIKDMETAVDIFTYTIHELMDLGGLYQIYNECDCMDRIERFIIGFCRLYEPCKE